jgi:phosphoribosylformimino-5-aminoimidazole carboxamide ribotide isomerase
MIDLIPAIDIIGGKCVRLVQGKYDRKTEYSDHPEEIALRFQDAGIRRLHLVDLDGARAGHVVNLDVLKRISEQTSLQVDFGGGVKTGDDLRKVFEAGAKMVTAGSIAVKKPELVKEWIRDYGPQKIILGADVKQGRIAIQGWQEETELDLGSFVENWLSDGIRKVICTDIAVDGMLTGPSLGLYRDLCTDFPGLDVIASGGVSGIGDIVDLESTGVKGVIFGKAYYEGKITETEIRNYLKSEKNAGKKNHTLP